MATWHQNPCGRPEVRVVGDALYCIGCDTTATIDQISRDGTMDIPPLPEPPQIAVMKLTWPKSVHYWKDEDIDVNSTERRDIDATAHNTTMDTTQTHSITITRPFAAVFAPLKAKDQIRLLLLSKGNFNDPIHGTLVLARLSGGIKFQALSYTWADSTGDKSRCQVIFLGPRWDSFAVTANCNAALRRMRRNDMDRMVWVDAVCIDQGNHAERNHQVGLMRKIYTHASEVFVYLGEGSSWTDEALERLRWAAEHRSIDSKGQGYLTDLFSMQYFHRIWIIQEIYSAQSAMMHCGNQTLGWSVLDQERLSTLGVVNEVPQWISTMYRCQEYTTRDLKDILLYTHSSKASDPRDMVFALLGVVNDADEHGLVADYDLTVREGYIGVAAFLIMRHHDCTVLEYAIGRNTTNSYFSKAIRDVPTWVPIWHASPIPGRSRGLAIAKGSKTFEGHIILRAEHVMAPLISNQIRSDVENPRIHHITGCLDILALKLMDLSCFRGPWGKFWEYGGPGTRKHSYSPALAISIDTFTAKTELVLLNGCDAIFQIEKCDDSKYQIVGICNICLLFDKPNAYKNEDRLEMDTVSRLMKQNCSLKRRHLQEVITLEIALRRLNCWDDERYPSLDIVPCESMFSDAMIAKAFNNHINRNIDMSPGKIETQTQHGFSSSGKEGKGDGCFPTPLHVQWLETRLSFVDSGSSWEKINALKSIHSDWLRWKSIRADVEFLIRDAIQYQGTSGYTLSQVRELSERPRYVPNWAKFTLSITNQLAAVIGSSHVKRCRVRIGERHLHFLQPAGSGEPPEATEAGMRDDVLEIIKRTYIEQKHSLQAGYSGLRQEDNGSYSFIGWDWSELEAVMKNVEDLASEGMTELQNVCSLRTFLKELQPQRRTWERLTLC
jgi:hypothetical protein